MQKTSSNGAQSLNVPYDDNLINHNWSEFMPEYHLGLEEMPCKKCKGSGVDSRNETCEYCGGNGSY